LADDPDEFALKVFVVLMRLAWKFRLLTKKVVLFFEVKHNDLFAKREATGPSLLEVVGPGVFFWEPFCNPQVFPP